MMAAMRCAVLVLVLLPTLAAAAPAPHGPGCQLAAAECIVVAREMAADDIETIDDERAFGHPTDLQEQIALIHRHYARMRAHIAHLPPRVGQEFARLRNCQAGDRLAFRQGTTNDDPKCR